MTSITISLTDDRAVRLEHLARESNLSAEKLVQMSVDEWLSRPSDDFLRAAEWVLSKNEELYKRLA